MGVEEDLFMFRRRESADVLRALGELRSMVGALRQRHPKASRLRDAEAHIARMERLITQYRHQVGVDQPPRLVWREGEWARFVPKDWPKGKAYT